MQKKRLVSCLLIFTVIFGVVIHALAAENGSRPNRANAIKQIKEYLEAFYQDKVSCTNLKYVNGYEKDRNNYVVVAEYTLTLQKNPEELEKDIAKANSVDTCLFSLTIFYFFGEKAKAGDSVTLTREYPFKRTENGWLLVSKW